MLRISSLNIVKLSDLLDCYPFIIWLLYSIKEIFDFYNSQYLNVNLSFQIILCSAFLIVFHLFVGERDERLKPWISPSLGLDLTHGFDIILGFCLRLGMKAVGLVKPFIV